MSGRDVVQTGMLLTGDADANGLVTVASTTTLRAGMVGNISSSTEASAEIQIVEVVSSTTFRAKLTRAKAPVGEFRSIASNGINYGTSDLSIYDQADTARVDFPRQFVWNEPAVA